MEKYKVIKELPFTEKWFEFIVLDKMAKDRLDRTDSTNYIINELVRDDNFDALVWEWFEEVKENRNIYDLKYWDSYYYLKSWDICDTQLYNDEIDSFRINTWIAFLTRKEAEKELEIIELRWKLLRSKHDMGVGKKWVKWERNYFIASEQGDIFNSNWVWSFTGMDLWYFTDKVYDFIEKNKEDLEKYFKLLQ